MTKKIAVLTGGGDCPGLNNAIKRIVLGLSESYDIEGLAQGWLGPIRIAQDRTEEMINAYTLPLVPENVRKIDREGGTMLMSSRANPFNYKGKDISDEVVKFLNQRYSGVIAIGGEDTLGAAGKMSQKGLRVIGLPKTIDKDLCGTEYTLGFDSAVNIVEHQVLDLKSTAGSHGMTYFIEVMGRKAGHLTYWSGRAANSHFITIPEIETDCEKLFTEIYNRKSKMEKKRGFTLDGLRYTIILVSEGTRVNGIGEIIKGNKDDHGNVLLGGVADYLCNEYVKATGDDSAKSESIGRFQRAGPPSIMDKIMGQSFAQASIELIKKDDFGRMVKIEQNYISDIPLEIVIGRIRILDVPKCYDQEKFTPIVSSEKLYHEIEVAKR